MKIKETRRMSMDDLRTLCIENNWFTQGDCEEYDKFLHLSGSGKKHITTAVLQKMAQTIEQYSTRKTLDGMEITDIMYLLANICYSTFDSIE